MSYLLQLYKLTSIKTILMLAALNISQLIADDLGSVDFCIDIGMGVAIYPHINPTVSDIVMQVHLFLCFIKNSS